VPASKTPAWLHQAVFYQVYPQSFFDSNQDGIGDIAGLIQKLPYILSLGCNALWINPWFDSPFQDAGYDVADYYKVAPRYGSNADAARLFAAAKKLGLRICLDLVPAHTSIQHPWFKQSALPQKNKHSDWFIWTDSAWAGPDEKGMEGVRGYSDRDGAYVTSFFYSQPALNFGFAKPDPQKPWQLKQTHPAVKAVTAEMLKVMRFWLKMGADGFRVDMAGHMVKQDPGQAANIKLWQGISRSLKKEFPQAVLISEWGVPSRALRAGFDVDFMLHFPTQGYNSLFRHGKRSYFHPDSPVSAKEFLDEYLGHRRKAQGLGHIAVISGNHDMDRIGLGRNAEEMKACFAFLATLPGVPFIYYGDEIGMDKVVGLDSKEGGYNRTGSRTPMQWTPGTQKGFSKADPKKFYLPVDARAKAPTVAAQEGDPESLLTTVRKLLALRHASPALQAEGSFTILKDGSGGKPLVFIREKGAQRILVLIQPKRRSATIRLNLPRTEMEPLASQKLSVKRHSKTAWDFNTQGVGFGLFELYRG
jgi:maltose alpha-D-glucosyltransferase/alpha-amylase